MVLLLWSSCCGPPVVVLLLWFSLVSAATRSYKYRCHFILRLMSIFFGRIFLILSVTLHIRLYMFFVCQMLLLVNTKCCTKHISSMFPCFAPLGPGSLDFHNMFSWSSSIVFCLLQPFGVDVFVCCENSRVYVFAIIDMQIRNM